MPTDLELITATNAGDLASYDELMRRYERLVFSVAYGIAGQRDAALDLVQAVFLKALRGLPRFDGRASFKTWLMRIVLNEGQDWRRRYRRRDAPLAPLELADAAVAEVEDPETTLLRAEANARLRRGLAALNARQRTAVALRYFQELPIREIADILGCSDVGARNLLFRSLQRLRGALAPGAPEGVS